jgi:hypothetical protein
MTYSGFGREGSDVVYGTPEIEVVLREQLDLMESMRDWTVVLSAMIR